MNKVRNVHSPSGMGFSTSGVNLTTLKDCPVCKYGTVDLVNDGRLWRCADCGHEYEATQTHTHHDCIL